MSEPRRIKMDYRKVNLDELTAWLNANNIKHAIPPSTRAGEIGRLIYFLEVYDARVETAVRLKWDTE